MALLVELMFLFFFLVAGYLLQLPFLIGISVVCIAVWLYMYKTYEELASLITVYFSVSAAIGNLLMWIIYLYTTHSTRISHWLHAYLFR